MMGLALAMGSTGCSHLFYHPTNIMYVQNLEQIEKLREEIPFQSLDGTKLAGWFFKAAPGAPKKGTVIQFHGNAENMTSHFASLFWMIEHGYDFFTFDYRGYGISEGSPNQEGLNQDALAAIRYILKRQAHESKEPDIVLYGQSLGGAVLMRAYDDVTPEERKRIKAMVIESSFHNYHAMGADVLSRSFLTWLFQPLAYVIVSNAYGPQDSIPRISPTPMFIMHGDRDPVIPFSFGEKIATLAKVPKKFLKIPGGSHINSMMVENGKFRPELIQFLDAAGSRAGSN